MVFGTAQAGVETAGQAAAEYDVAKLLEQLPEPYRRVVVLFYLEDRTCEEVGELLSMPTGTVKALLHRGRKTSRRPGGRDVGDRIMNRTVKTREIEARLDRSLREPGARAATRWPFRRRRLGAHRGQEHAQTPRLQPVSRRSNAERWLFASNVIGLVVAIVLVVFFGCAAFSRASR